MHVNREIGWLTARPSSRKQQASCTKYGVHIKAKNNEKSRRVDSLRGRSRLVRRCTLASGIRGNDSTRTHTRDHGSANIASQGEPCLLRNARPHTHTKQTWILNIFVPVCVLRAGRLWGTYCYCGGFSLPSSRQSTPPRSSSPAKRELSTLHFRPQKNAGNEIGCDSRVRCTLLLPDRQSDRQTDSTMEQGKLQAVCGRFGFST